MEILRKVFFCLWAMGSVAGLALVSSSVRAQSDTPPLQEDLKKLNALGIPTEGQGLLDYFRKRTFSQVKPETMEELVAQLGDPDFQTREKAFAEIMKLEAAAKPGLEQAKESPIPEVRSRARVLLDIIEEKSDPALQGTVARVIAARNPPDACEVLLNYLPFMHKSVIDDFRSALLTVGFDKGKPNPLMVAALKDKFAIKRQMAGELLAKNQALGHLPALTELLQDKNHYVRFHVAMGLLKNKQNNPGLEKASRKALETLIDLMAHLQPEELWPAEYLLVRLAGQNEPSVTLGTTEDSRLRCRQAWQQWWQQHGKTVDLSRLDNGDTRLGRILVIHQTPNRFVNGKLKRGGRKVMELDAGKRTRWEFVIENTNPVDVQGIGPRKLLLAEYAGRVSERDLDGRILPWEKYIKVIGGRLNNPVAAQRLPNGNTFVVTRNLFLEWDKDGKKIYSFSRNRNDICMGGKLSEGTVVFVTNSGLLTYLDSKTNQTKKTINIGRVVAYNGGMEILPNNHLLIPLYSNNRIVEYDAKGKKVWEANVSRPTTVTRLPNGHTIVGSLYTRELIELNNKGQQVWSRKLEGQIYQVGVR